MKFMVVSVSCLTVMVWALGGASGFASNQSSTAAKATNATVIAVTAGKPSELAFKLSKFSKLSPGTFTFKVTNVGYAFHDFKICTAAVKTAAKNTCAGKATAILKHGQTATLTVTITKAGLYEYMCSVPGHASAGMKGLIGVGVVAAAPVVTAPTTTTKTTSTTTTSGGGGSTTTTATTTTATGGGGGGGGGGSNADGCPAGTTIATAGFGGDGDADDDGAGPTDGDGCV